jgi:hypothetical protein
MMRKVVLNSSSNFDISRVVFEDVKVNEIKNEKNPKAPAIKYKTIPVKYRCDDGTLTDLLFETPQYFSFGVSENTSMDTDQINGYSLPLCLLDKDRPSNEEKDFLEMFNNLVENCREHLYNIRSEIGREDSERRDFSKKGGLNPVFQKKEEYTDESGRKSLRIVPGSSPIIYPKFMYSKKEGKILTRV